MYAKVLVKGHYCWADSGFTLWFSFLSVFFKIHLSSMSVNNKIMAGNGCDGFVGFCAPLIKQIPGCGTESPGTDFLTDFLLLLKGVEASDVVSWVLRGILGVSKLCKLLRRFMGLSSGPFS